MKWKEKWSIGGGTATTFSIKAQTTVKKEIAGMPLIQSAAASFHLKKESTGYFEIISLHFLSFSTIFDEGRTCLLPLHINHKQGGRRLTNFRKLITPLWGSIFFVPPNNFQVSDPWRVFWADLTPFKDPQPRCLCCFRIYNDTWALSSQVPLVAMS